MIRCISSVKFVDSTFTVLYDLIWQISGIMYYFIYKSFKIDKSNYLHLDHIFSYYLLDEKFCLSLHFLLCIVISMVTYLSCIVGLVWKTNICMLSALIFLISRKSNFSIRRICWSDRFKVGWCWNACMWFSNSFCPIRGIIPPNSFQSKFSLIVQNVLSFQLKIFLIVAYSSKLSYQGALRSFLFFFFCFPFFSISFWGIFGCIAYMWFFFFLFLDRDCRC